MDFGPFLDATVVPEVIAEVSPATPPMQGVYDSWMGLITRGAVGVWFCCWINDSTFRNEFDPSFGQIYLQLNMFSGSVNCIFWFGFTE